MRGTAPGRTSGAGAEPRLRAGDGALDGLHLVRYSQYATTGGASLHVQALNHELARRHAVTIHQLYLLTGREAVVEPRMVEVGPGRIELRPLDDGSGLPRPPDPEPVRGAVGPVIRAALRRAAIALTLGDNGATDLLRAAAGAAAVAPFLPDRLPVSRRFPLTRVRAGRLLRLQSACAAELDDILRRSAGGRVILVNHLPAELDGLVVSREAAQRGLPVGIEHHTGRPRGRELLFARQRRLARRAGAVAPLGLEPLLGPDPVDLGNGIDTVFFDRRRASPPGTFRARHPALAGDRRLLVAPGHIATRKRQLDLLEAAQTLRSGLGVNDFVLVLPGAVREPAYRERLLAYRQRHGLAGHVLLLDHLDPTELRDAYADSDLGLLASEFEGRPRVVLEMGAMAVPVVATDLPGIRDCLLPGESGLLVPVADPRSLAAAVAGLLRDPDRREAFGRAGASFVRERHSLPALADRHVAFYLEILHGGATTAPRSGRALC